MVTKLCSNCGDNFGCGAENGDGSCWCADSPLVEIIDGADCRCPKCLAQIVEAEQQSRNQPPVLVEGVDYYLEGAAFVFTELYHLKRGYCCENNCRHCPFRKAEGAT